LVSPSPQVHGELMDETEWPIPPPRRKSISIGVHWFRANMSPLKAPPVLPIEGLARPAKAGKRFCVMSVSFSESSNGIPRVRLERRSGLFGFDQAAVKHCIRWLRHRAFEDSGFKPPESVTVVWVFDAQKAKVAPPNTSPKISPTPPTKPKVPPKPPVGKPPKGGV
jgi:hypothetical protein